MADVQPLKTLSGCHESPTSNPFKNIPIQAPRASAILKTVFLIVSIKLFFSLPIQFPSFHFHFFSFSANNNSSNLQEPPTAPTTPTGYAAYFNLTPNTTLNFMHFHKSGGTAIKAALYTAYANTTRTKPSTEWRKLILRDACYLRPPEANAENSTDLTAYVCNWDPLKDMPFKQRSSIDIAFGHQFLNNGLQSLLPSRQVRTFAIIRHPFDRKLSAFFHFMIRQMRKSEKDVGIIQIRDFLIQEKGNKGRGMKLDVGPNYLAGRLLSSGYSNYSATEVLKVPGEPDRTIHTWFDAPDDKKVEIAEKATKVMNNFLLIGIQHEMKATKCMIEKLLHGFDHVVGLYELAEESGGAAVFSNALNVTNVGGYKLKSKQIWEKLNEADRKRFIQREWVDLELFQRGLGMFKRQAVQLGCEHLISEHFSLNDGLRNTQAVKSN